MSSDRRSRAELPAYGFDKVVAFTHQFKITHHDLARRRIRRHKARVGAWKSFASCSSGYKYRFGIRVLPPLHEIFFLASCRQQARTNPSSVEGRHRNRSWPDALNVNDLHTRRQCDPPTYHRNTNIHNFRSPPFRPINTHLRYLPIYSLPADANHVDSAHHHPRQIQILPSP